MIKQIREHKLYKLADYVGEQVLTVSTLSIVIGVLYYLTIGRN
jgi:hypothetical protein